MPLIFFKISEYVFGFLFLDSLCRNGFVKTSPPKLRFLSRDFSPETRHLVEIIAPAIRNKWKSISKKMEQEAKQQKFHDALLKMLYPPPQEEGGEEGKLKNSTDSSYFLPGELADNNRKSSSSSRDDDNGENGGSEQLTRSQRKRLRKRKFKEAASRRREIIGPLLPNSTNDGNDGGADVTLQSVRQNTASGSSAATNNSGAPAFCAKKNKIKQRRKAKKL